VPSWSGAATRNLDGIRQTALNANRQQISFLDNIVDAMELLILLFIKFYITFKPKCLAFHAGENIKNIILQ
jgi:hypothetical protein